MILEKRKENIDFIPLGIGDPDLPTPDLIINELVKLVKISDNQNYPSSMGEENFREAIARWYKTRHNLDLDAKSEITNVIGGKEGVANISRVFINPGDLVLCPNPGYPVYENGAAKLCDAEAYSMPLLRENNFLPDLDAIEIKILKKAKLMYINYPNNPTGAIVSKDFLKKILDYAEDYDFLIVHDNPYSEFTFDDVKKYIEDYDDIAVAHCYCRHSKDLLDDPCKLKAPKNNCFLLDKSAKFAIEQNFGRSVSKEEAIQILKEAEDYGLVHKVFHVHSDLSRGIEAICNCCKCCCGILNFYSSGALPLHTVSSYLAEVDEEICTGCETCVNVCPMETIELESSVAVVQEEKCIGCGICTHQCPEEAIHLKRTGPRDVFIQPKKIKVEQL